MTLGTKADLDQVLGWLEREFTDGVNDFWYNRRLIAKAVDEGDFYVVRDGGEAVAFQIGHYAADIANVRKDRQGEGFGTALLEAAVARAYRDGINVLDVECAPATSLTFWQRHGFERYSQRGQLRARRVLQRSTELPSDLPRHTVTITFYPERITYERDEHVEPQSVHEAVGALKPDGTLMLDHRVIGFDDAGPEGGEVAVKVEVDGDVLYLGRAKYADEAGVQRDWKGGAFYVDAVKLGEGWCRLSDSN